MDISTLRLTILIVLCIAFIQLGVVEKAKANAVGGSARSIMTNDPLEMVDVIIVGKTINDKTRKPDGVFVLNVPSNIRQFDIMFKKAGYFDAFDPDIINNKKHNKRPIAMMVPIESTNKLTGDQITKIVEDSTYPLTRVKGKDVLSVSDLILIEAGRKNLIILYNNIQPSDDQRKYLKAKIQSLIVKTTAFVQSESTDARIMYVE